MPGETRACKRYCEREARNSKGIYLHMQRIQGTRGSPFFFFGWKPELAFLSLGAEPCCGVCDGMSENWTMSRQSVIQIATELIFGEPMPLEV